MPYRSVTVRGVALLCFPPGDAVFSSMAGRMLTSAPKKDPFELQRALRGIYARAVVRARDSLASIPGAAWYVYRDGRYSPFVDAERWWEDPAVARIVLSDDGRYLDGTPAALELLGIDRDELRSATAGDFAVPEYREIVPWIIQLLRDTGELHSTSMLRPRTGPDVAVEYHFTRDGDGAGRHVSAMRPVPIEAVNP
jgi:PAS domain S-box-containing protein